LTDGEKPAESDVAGSEPLEAGLETTGSYSDVRLRGLIHDLRNAVGFVTHSASQLGRYIDDLMDLIGFFEDLTDGLGEKEQALLQEFRALVPIDVATEEIPGVMQTIREGERRITAILEQLRPDHLGDQGGEDGNCDLVATVETALSIFSSNHGSVVEFLSELEVSPRIACDGVSVGRLLDNLLVNAVKAVTEEGEGGTVHVIVKPAPLQAGVELVVRDDGVGMTPEVLKRVFQPYFTTRRGRGGTGLGLAVVREVVDACKGEVTIESSPGQGTTFSVVFPAVATDEVGRD